MKDKIKIAIVSDAIYPYNKGGKEKRIFELSTRLAKSGYDVHIYCMKWWTGENQREENNVHLHAISKFYPLYSGKRRSIKQALLFAISCLSLVKENFDIIEVDHMPHFVLFSTKIVTLLKRKKLYVTWNEVWGRKYWKEYLGKLGNIAYIVEWLSARLPDEIIAVSTHTKTQLIKQLKIKQKIHVVPNGIDLNYIEKIKPAKELSDLIYAGRLLSHKNVDMLLKVTADLKKKIPNIKTIIVGNGPDEKHLKNLAKQLGIENNVSFVNFLEDHSYLYSLMKSSKAFVFPSEREGFGIVALEANACNIPVVTVDAKNNAAKYLIQNGKNGYIASLNRQEISKKTMIALHKKGKNDFKDLLTQFDWEYLKDSLIGAYNI